MVVKQILHYNGQLHTQLHLSLITFVIPNVPQIYCLKGVLKSCQCEVVCIKNDQPHLVKPMGAIFCTQANGRTDYVRQFENLIVQSCR